MPETKWLGNLSLVLFVHSRSELLQTMIRHVVFPGHEPVIYEKQKICRLKGRLFISILFNQVIHAERRKGKSFIAGTGLRRDRYELEIRVERGMGFERFLAYNTNTTTGYLLLKYYFINR